MRAFTICLVFCLSPVRVEASSGWLVSGDDRVMASNSTVMNSREALVLRTENETRFDLRISPIRDTSVWSSFHPVAYSLLMRFTASTPLTDPVKIFVPVLESAHFTETQVHVDAAGTLLLSFRSDAVGMDLFSAALFAPGGVIGVATYGQSERTVVLRANPSYEGMRLATVRTVTNTNRHTVVRIESQVEFPIRIKGVTGSSDRLFHVRRTLRPWKYVDVRLPAGENAGALRITKSIERSVPQVIQQHYE